MNAFHDWHLFVCVILDGECSEWHEHIYNYLICICACIYLNLLGLWPLDPKCMSLDPKKVVFPSFHFFI